jgi:putative addiction module component (TIGR02574 family)
LGEKLAFRSVFGYGSFMSIDQIAAEALRLSPSQRAMLAESLWESLSDPFQSAEADDSSTIELAAERDRQMESGEVQAISHEELMSRLRR